jgi:hypothetical protein
MRVPLFARIEQVALGMLACLFLGGCSGCDDKALTKGGPAASASAPQGLTPELAAKVLVRVGDREITLGEYAATVERMDQFERLRYQSPDRRKQLLDEIIKVELLAAEARRRGLDKLPETQERIRQILRDEVLRETRAGIPTPAQIPESEVRAYYEKNRAEFQEPERRRVASIVMSDEGKAKQVLALALKATPMEWGKLVQEHSLDKPPRPSPTTPLELAGDLGIVSPPGESRGENPKVPEPVRKAVFQIEKLGGVYPELVKNGDRFHIVRMSGKTDARDRAFAEAERTIRVAILQRHVRDAEERLEKDLRARFPVKIDDAALARVKVPSPNTVGTPAPPTGSPPSPPKK